MKAVNTHRFLGPCKLFVSPRQKATDTEHALRCLSPVITWLASRLKAPPKEERGQIFAAMSIPAWLLNHVYRPDIALRNVLSLCS